MANYQLSASSTHEDCSLARSRLHTQQNQESHTEPWAGSWCAGTNTDTQWIQVSTYVKSLHTAARLNPQKTILIISIKSGNERNLHTQNIYTHIHTHTHT